MESMQATEFQNEVFHLIEEISESLHSFAQTPDDNDLIYKNFLYWHEIKSLATLYDLYEIAKLAHSIETRFEYAARKNLPLNNKIIQHVKDSIDYLKGAVQSKIYNQPIEQDLSTILGGISSVLEDKKVEQQKKPKAKETKTKVLIVEDEEINRALLEAHIQNSRPDIEIVSVESAEEGLYHFFTDRFSLIFLDIMMPIIDGNDFIAIVEKNLIKKNITHPCNIVVQTAIQSISQLTLFAKCNCVQEVMKKPISPERIVECLERYC